MVEEVVKTKDQLLADMQAAMTAGDWKAVSKVSSEIAKAVAADEKAEKDVKLAALATLTETVKNTLGKAVEKILDHVTPEEMEAMDGIWYVQDFGEKLSSCRLTKGAVRKAGGTGGGAGKKFNITTTDLLTKHGAEQVTIGDRTMTYQEFYNEDTGGNARYKVRMKLLKVEGLS